MADTGLLISHAFDENGIVSEEIYKKLLFDKLSVNSGMLMENIVAQMLTASGHKLYFFSKSSRENSQDRMEIDFLIAKSKITNKHNISPIEVKSGDRYALSSIKKFINKYKEVTPSESLYIDDRNHILQKAKEYGFNLLLMDRYKKYEKTQFEIVNNMSDILKILE